MSSSESDPLIPTTSSGGLSQSYNSITAESNKESRTVTYCVHGIDSDQCCQVTCIRDGTDSVNFNLPHCHFYDEERSRIDKQARYRLILASALCLSFMVIEIIGGLLANSLAIASDAAHLLTDFASFMISLFSIWVASRPSTSRMSFGWHRAEVIGALTSILMIWVVTGILCYIATERLVANNFEIQGLYMVITATIGVVVNLIMGFSLTFGRVPHGLGHSHGDDHDHEDGHDYETQPGFSSDKHRGTSNINVRAALVHVIGDFFQSVGVLVASVVIYYFPEYRLIDPICTYIFSIIVLFTTFTIIRDVLNVLMEGIPKGINIKDVNNIFFDILGVRKVHNLRIWSLSLDKAALSAHLVIDKGYDPKKLLNKALQEIKSRFDIYELTIQIEEYEENMDGCKKCQCLP